MPDVAERSPALRFRTWVSARTFGHIGTLVLSATLLVSPDLCADTKKAQAVAQPSSSGSEQVSAADHKQAAALYDAALRHVKRAEYAEAAQKFLAADALAPNSEALTSAIAAARRAQEHLLVAIASERAILREASDPTLAANARQALADAVPHLSRLEVECSSTPCELTLDGEPINLGRVYALPGIYVLHAKGPNGSSAEERLRTTAGATYRVVLHPEASGGAPDAKTVVTPAPTATPVTPVTHTDTRAQPDKEQKKERPLSPAVFYTAAAVSAVLIGLTTWSGIDALNAKSDLPDAASQGDIDKVKSRVLRTDLLLAGSALATGFTVYSGIYLVDFGGSKDKPSGAVLELRGRF